MNILLQAMRKTHILDARVLVLLSFCVFCFGVFLWFVGGGVNTSKYFSCSILLMPLLMVMMSHYFSCTAYS